MSTHNSHDLQKDKVVENGRRVGDRIPGVVVHGLHVIDT